MSWIAGDWMKRVLMRDAQGLSDAPAKSGFNPHPAGVMQADGTSYLLLRLFVAHPSTWFTAGELQRRSKRSRQSVSWALQFLRARGVLLVSEDGRRNPRYQRYRLAVDLPASKPPAPGTDSAPQTEDGTSQVPLDLKF